MNNITFAFENFGFVKNGNIQLNDLTIICGDNNSGKSYLSYIIYGILKDLNNLIDFPIDNKDHILKTWHENQYIELNLNNYQEKINKKEIGNLFSKKLDEYFSTISYFNDSKINVDFAEVMLKNKSIEEDNFDLGDKSIYYEKNYKAQTIKMWSKDKINLPNRFLIKLLSTVIYDYFYDIDKNKPFIVSSDRNGISLFYKELDFTKNELIDLIKKDKIEEINIFELLRNNSSAYPEPIKDNIKTIRDYENLRKNKSFISLQAENKNAIAIDLLNLLTDVIGGNFKVDKNKGINFYPKKVKGVSVPLHITASATKSLLPIDLYIRNLAEEGDILIIDEPELHLSIDNQRKMAGLITCIVNMGLKCIITTHSDFLIREINNRILLNKDFKDKDKFLKKSHILKSETIDIKKVSAFEINSKGIIETKNKTDFGLNVDFFEKKIQAANDLLIEIANKI